MNLLTIGAAAIAMVAAVVSPNLASAQSKGKVLVVMSSAHELDLKGGKKYKTGYYLNEFAIPYRKLIEAGYGGDDKARADAADYVKTIDQLKHPKTLESVVKEGTDGYVGLFIPGGHAPMADLIKDKNLGKILVSFHETGRPTGIICHGPIVLLSALPDPDAFIASMIAGDGKASSLTTGWPYAGYRATIFSTGEEQALEGPNGLGGNVQFYPVNALAEAGARVESIANWHSNVVVDRELITGQQPMSAPEFGDALVAKLNEKK
jgi:putative intracellular protease/amidase